jgi:ATP-dependent Zn protease
MNKKRSDAYHEAGHAVAAYRFGHEVGKITIVSEGYKAGSSKIEAEWADKSKYIIVLYAGYAAESKFDKDADKRLSSGDDEKAAALLEHHNETETSLRMRAKKIIDENWEIIEAIAEKLFKHKTLREDEWTTIIDAFDDGKDWEEYFDKMSEALGKDKRCD